MEVLDSLCDSFEKLPSFLLLQPMLLFGKQIVVERIGASVLLDEVDFGACLDGLD